jgi:hypothetical protein
MNSLPCPISQERSLETWDHLKARDAKEEKALLRKRCFSP